MLRSSGYPELGESLDVIERSVHALWASVDLQEYTDHGPRHSERVAAYAERIVQAREIIEPFGLSLPERYLLAAAAWLHDIGMQDPRSDPLDPESDEVSSPGEVRRRHASRAEHIINAGEIDLGLPASEVLAPQIIALIALAHGTSTYKAAAKRLETEGSSFKGGTIRAARLAAVLLMADELDVHYERVPSGHPLRPLNRESAAHWLKHECVRQVDFADTPGGLEILIQLSYPVNLEPSDRLSVREWIVSKFQQQIALTEAVLEDGFHGYLNFSKRIVVEEYPSVRTSAFVHPVTIAVVERENARGRLINHQVCLGGAIAGIGAGNAVQLVGPINHSGDDEAGREDVLDAVVSRFNAEGVTVMRNSTLGARFGATAISETLAGWLIGTFEVVFERGQISEGELRKILLVELREALSAAPESNFLLAFSGLDISSSDGQWLCEALSSLAVLSNVGVVVTSDEPMPGSDFESVEPVWTPIEIGRTPTAEIAEYLNRVMRNEDAEIHAASFDGSYAMAKAEYLRYVELVVTK